MKRHDLDEGVHGRTAELRRSLGLTQQQFGERLGVNRSTIANLELGRSIPRLPLLRHICREFGASEDWLFRGSGAMFARPGTYYFRALEADFSLGETDRALILAYLRLPEERRAALRRGLEALRLMELDKEREDEKT